MVETNNLRGAETSPYDGWLDVRGSPYSDQAKFIERIRRPTYGKLEIDITLDDPKAYTKPFTLRVNQQISPDDEIIEFICNENQQFRRRVKIDLNARRPTKGRPDHEDGHPPRVPGRRAVPHRQSPPRSGRKLLSTAPPARRATTPATTAPAIATRS